MRFPVVLALFGELGAVGACIDTSEPAHSSHWVTLAASEHYTCGLSLTSEAFCWGWVPGYYDPQPLKDSLIPKSALPLPVPGGYRFTDITVGGLSICALDAERRARCWGANLLGEVGDGSFIAKRTPSPVVGDLRWQTISAGGAHTCGVTIDHQAYCWGDEFRGALGNGQLLFGGTPRPVAVLGNLSWVAVYAGIGTSCGITIEGDAYCWGVNDYGMLGDGQPPVAGPDSAAPSRVVGNHRFTSLAVGTNHVCGLTQDAQVYCWGWNGHGQLGNGTTVATSLPTLVNGDLRWAAISLGNQHSCGQTTDGAVYCWGSNVRGQFGNDATEDSSIPVRIAPPGVYIAIIAGGNHTCGRTANGTAFCWGQGNYGQLGDGIFEDRSRPVQVASPD